MAAPAGIFFCSQKKYPQGVAPEGITLFAALPQIERYALEEEEEVTGWWLYGGAGRFGELYGG